MTTYPNSPESQAYADAIMDAVEQVARRHGQGNIGALLGALVGVQAHFIGGVGDRKIRKTLQKQLDGLLRDLIAEQVSERSGARIEVMINRAH